MFYWHETSITYICSSSSIRSKSFNKSQTDLNVLNDLNHLNNVIRASLLHPSLQKPSPAHPVVVDPQEVAAAGFGEVILAMNFPIPPAAGEDVRAGEFVHGTIPWSPEKPAVVMRCPGRWRQRNWLCKHPAD